MCRKCVDACPTHAIIAVNFPAPRAKAGADGVGNDNVEFKEEEVKA